jgi:flagellar biosynthetic protein FliQ
MAEAEVAAAMRETLLLIVKIGGPPLLAVLVAGVIVSVLQAVTQINESTLAYLPKVIALAAVIALLGSSMVAQLSDYTRLLFDRVVAAGGS